MKIGLIQHNPVSGDFSRNTQTIINLYRECVEKGAELVIAPPTALTGYNADGLLTRTAFRQQCVDALGMLGENTLHVPLCVGAHLPCDEEDDETGEPEEQPRYIKTLAILQDGEIIEAHAYREDNPDYTSFPVSIGKLNILVCTDEFHFTPPYSKVDLILYITDKGWFDGKDLSIRRELSRIAQKAKTPVAYCTATGTHDDVIMGSSSFVINTSGDLVAKAKPFVEDALVADTKSKGTPIPSRKKGTPSLASDIALLHEALVLSIRDYCTKTGIESACIGLSGGIDSAVVAALAVEALGPKNVLGITMPSPFSSQGSIDDSLELAKNLGIRCEIIPITPVFEAVKTSLAPLFKGRDEDVTEENMQSRIRGLFLMAASNKFNSLLLATGNKSEIALGYCTLYGDTCGGLAPIGDIYKGRVYELAKYINRQKTLIPVSTMTKAPSAELRPNQKDSDSLPDYDLLDDYLPLVFDMGYSSTTLLEKNPSQKLENALNLIDRRIAQNEWKRRQMALVPKVALHSHGKINIPIVHKFRD